MTAIDGSAAAAAANILERIEDDLSHGTSHDKILRSSLRAQFLVEFGHATQEEAHEAIWRGVQASGYLRTHSRKDIERILSWVASKVEEAVLAGTAQDELESTIELEWDLDVFEDERKANASDEVDQENLSQLPELLDVAELPQFEPQEWLYQPLIARKRLHLLAGREGLGKGVISTELCVRMARNGKRVAFFSLEDDANDMAGRREVAAYGGGERGGVFLFHRGRLTLAQIEGLIRQHRLDVVFLDPGRSYFGRTPSASSNDDAYVRAQMEGFLDVVERTGCAIVMLHHTNKATRDKNGHALAPRQVIHGSGSFQSAPRLVLYLAADADGGLALGIVKSNVGHVNEYVDVQLQPLGNGRPPRAIMAPARDDIGFEERITRRTERGEARRRRFRRAGPRRDSRLLRETWLNAVSPQALRPARRAWTHRRRLREDRQFRCPTHRARVARRARQSVHSRTGTRRSMSNYSKDGAMKERKSRADRAAEASPIYAVASAPYPYSYDECLHGRRTQTESDEHVAQTCDDCGLTNQYPRCAHIATTGERCKRPAPRWMYDLSPAPRQRRSARA